ncbi:MAG: AAA family ATPase, partial [Acidobacteria bacterium]|nr:AAA family ATPase [Acidobacteriota bacterium]
WHTSKESQLREVLALPLNQKISTYSKGMLVKLSLLLAFSQGATVLMLDEPFAGLDPLVREELLRVIHADVENDSRTLILTSHDLFAVEVLVQDLWILHKGRFIFQGPLDSFLNRYRSFLIEGDQESAPWTPPRGALVRELSSRGKSRRLQVVLASDQSRVWLSTLTNVAIHSVENRVSLQDAYGAYLNLYTESNNA